jgi:hypothetical protein
MRRPEVSPRGLASGIQMCQFYINRAGKSLPEERKNEIRKAIGYLQTELKYYNALNKGGGSEKQYESEWKKLNSEVDLSGEPIPYRGPGSEPNIYLDRIADLQKSKQEQKMGNKYIQKIAEYMNPSKD